MAGKLGKLDREVITRVEFSPYASAVLRELGTTVRATPDDVRISVDMRSYRYLPKGDYPIVPYKANAWTVFLGGLSALVRVPSLDGASLDPARVVGIFADAGTARDVFNFQRTMIRRTLLLSYIDNVWYARMKFASREGKTLVVNPSGRRVWKPKRKPRKPRRWFAAPADWPRTTTGKLMSNVGAARKISRERSTTGGTD